MALGAQARGVIWLFIRRGMLPVAAGLVVGLAGAFAVGSLLQGLLIDTSSTDANTLVFIAALLMLASLAACFLPARRAARLNPVAVLRCE